MLAVNVKDECGDVNGGGCGAEKGQADQFLHKPNHQIKWDIITIQDEIQQGKKGHRVWGVENIEGADVVELVKKVWVFQLVLLHQCK